MVVSFDIYAVLMVIELIICIFAIFMLDLFVRRDERLSKVIRLIIVIVLMLVNLAQIHVGIRMEKSIAMDIVCVVLCFIFSLKSSFELGKKL